LFCDRGIEALIAALLVAPVTNAVAIGSGLRWCVVMRAWNLLDCMIIQKNLTS
jgi:hypothetical protein